MNNKTSTKKIKAPVSYDPGKGRPKEYLAYLNYQEMQALKRLNGEGPYKGPKGIPSFVLGGATTRGTAANRAMSSASQSNKTSTGTGARGPTGPQGQARTSPAGGTPGAVSRSSGSGFSGISGGGARDSGQATARQTAARQAPAPSSRFPSSGGGGRDSGQAAARADSSFKQAAERQNTTAASRTPALKQDRQRTINVGPMGTPVKVGAPSGQGQRIVPRATVTTPMATQGPSFRSPLDARISNRFAINDAKLRSGALGIEGVPSVSQIAAENARRLNTIKMAQQYAQYPSPPGSYPAAPQGVFGPRAGFDAGYLRTATIPGMFTEGQTYGPSTRQVPGPAGFYAEVPSATLPGEGKVPPAMQMRPGFTPDNPLRISSKGFVAPTEIADPRSNAEATLRAYEEAKRLSPKIQDRVPVSGSLTVGRSAVVPTAPSLRAEDGVYKRPGRDPAVERALAEAGFDPSGRRLQELIDPSIPGRLAQTRIPSRAPSVTGPWPGQSAIPPNPSVYTPPPQPIGGGWPGQSAIPPNPPVYSPGGIPSIPAPTGEESIVPALGGLQAIPDPISMGLLAPPKPRMRPENIRPAAPIPKARPADLMGAYGDAVYPGVDGITGEDIGGVFEEGDGSVPDSAVPFSQINPETMKAYGAMLGPVGMVDFSRMAEPSVAGIGQLVGDTAIRPALSGYGNIGGEMVGSLGNRGIVVNSSPAAPQTARQNRAFGDAFSQGLPPGFGGSPGYGERYGLNEEKTLAVEDVPEGETRPQSGMTEEQRKEAQKIIRRGNRVAGQFVGTVTGPLGGLAARGGLKLYEKAKLAQLERYAAMTPAEKLAAEKKNPELIGWANRLGIDSESDYGDYLAWADKSGLRAPPSREGGSRDSSGIADLIREPRGEEEVPTPEVPSTPSGRRPDIYYMWDLGANIPSPSDPNYTQYQTYLAERLAAQRAVGYV